MAYWQIHTKRAYYRHHGIKLQSWYSSCLMFLSKLYLTEKLVTIICTLQSVAWVECVQDGAAAPATKCLQLKAARPKRPPGGQPEISGWGDLTEILRKAFHQLFCRPGENRSGEGNFGAGHHKGHCVGDQPAQVHHPLRPQLLQSRPHLSHQGMLSNPYLV